MVGCLGSSGLSTLTLENEIKKREFWDVWAIDQETGSWISCEEWFWTAAPPQSVRSIYLLAKNKYAEITFEHESVQQWNIH